MLHKSKYKYCFAAADVAVLALSLGGTIALISITPGIHISAAILIWAFVLFSLIMLFILGSFSLYNLDVILSSRAHTTAVIKAVGYGALFNAVAAILLFSLSLKFAAIATGEFIFFAVILFYLLRVMALKKVYTALSGRELKRDIIIVGSGSAGRQLAGNKEKAVKEGINILGFVDDIEVKNKAFNGIPHLGHFNELRTIISMHKADEIIISIDNQSYNDILAIIDECKKYNVRIKIASRLFNIIYEKTSAEKYAGIPVAGITSLKESAAQVIIKRVLDIILAAAGIVILSPVFLLIALMVKATSKGPIIFKQKRIGKNGRLFNFYKFRSMTVVDGEDEKRKELMIQFIKNNQAQKVINESRITWIGQYIRKTSVDELPQLFNVLKGDMSLVGPRPCLPYEYENYDGWQKRRVSVLPGCTGVWQVSGRSRVTFTDSILLDLYYINNMSPLMDIRLILKTVPVMLFSRGGK